MPKLILHIGFEKTGTTTAQAYLYGRQIEGLLPRQGIIYPQSVLTPNMAYHKLLVDQILSHGVIDNEYLNDLRDEIERSEAHTFIISCEHFHSDFTLENIKSLHKALDPLFHKIKVIAFVRNQAETAISHFSTRLMSGERLSSLAQVLHLKTNIILMLTEC